MFVKTQFMNLSNLAGTVPIFVKYLCNGPIYGINFLPVNREKKNPDLQPGLNLRLGYNFLTACCEFPKVCDHALKGAIE